MRIAFPIESYDGKESVLHPQIPTAPTFALVDTESQMIRHLTSDDQPNSKCTGLEALGSPLPDAIVVATVGAAALNALRHAGLRVYRSMNCETISDVLVALQQGTLLEVAASDACVTYHSCGGGCDSCGSSCGPK
ncbi:TPA: hypothetical protein DDW35_13655 [Candidatus Sumerlaeota bacterium]|nr:hypothetical protein [Candidatus Sumerlaeota bacterium]